MPIEARGCYLRQRHKTASHQVFDLTVYTRLSTLSHCHARPLHEVAVKPTRVPHRVSLTSLCSSKMNLLEEAGDGSRQSAPWQNRRPPPDFKETPINTADPSTPLPTTHPFHLRTSLLAVVHCLVILLCFVLASTHIRSVIQYLSPTCHERHIEPGTTRRLRKQLRGFLSDRLLLAIPSACANNQYSRNTFFRRRRPHIEDAKASTIAAATGIAMPGAGQLRQAYQ